MKNRYQKGAGFERELVELFWNNGWAAVRVAGSGSAPHPIPDVIGFKDGVTIAVECKSTNGERLSLKKAVDGLVEFETIAGCKCFLAVRFLREKPRFYELSYFIEKKNYTVKKSTPFHGFDVVIGSQKTL